MSRRFAPTRRRGWVVVDKELAPGRDTPGQILARAAAAPSLAEYVGKMAFMHPAYAELRRTLEWARMKIAQRVRRLCASTCSALRMLPAAGRYVLVNAASQQLQMIDNGRIVDEMKVVVGKPKNPTPVMAAYIRYRGAQPLLGGPARPGRGTDRAGRRDRRPRLPQAAWLCRPVRLGREGQRSVDPSTIDWQAVADGKIQVRLRQLPGPGNAMGRMKFMFPNSEGVYLHDTPNKELLKEDARLFSGGCVRLEDAPRLAKWMFGKPLQSQGRRRPSSGSTCPSRFRSTSPI